MNEEQPTAPPPVGSWQFKTEDTNAPVSETSVDTKPVAWSASEFISHDKDFGWFALLGTGTALLIIGVWFVTKDYVAAAAVLVVALLFGIYGVHKPRVRQYFITEQGIQIDNQQFSYGLFKSFSVIQEGGIRSVELMPMKRFMPIITMYMDPEDEEAITTALSQYVAFEQREQALLDKLMRRLRF